jgi:hypothetical protein
MRSSSAIVCIFNIITVMEIWRRNEPSKNRQAVSAVLKCVSAILMWWLLKNSEKDTMRNLQAEKEKKGVEDVEEKGDDRTGESGKACPLVEVSSSHVMDLLVFNAIFLLLAMIWLTV